MLDASSLVRAALAPGSAAGLLLAAALGGRARLAGSPETLQEAARVLVRPKFAARLSPEAREASIARLVAATEVVESAERVTECRDPMVLAAALAAGVAVIVSDDRDLLVLDPWRGVRVLKPEAALALLGGGQG
jgi:uncharacterized protein